MNADQALGVILNKVAVLSYGDFDVDREVDIIRRHLKRQNAEINQLETQLCDTLHALSVAVRNLKGVDVSDKNVDVIETALAAGKRSE